MSSAQTLENRSLFVLGGTGFIGKALVTEAVAAATEAVTGERPTSIPMMTWEEAAERYGSDKPDIRFGMELVELTPIFSGTEAKAFQATCIKGILVEGQGDIGRNRLAA